MPPFSRFDTIPGFPSNAAHDTDANISFESVDDNGSTNYLTSCPLSPLSTTSTTSSSTSTRPGKSSIRRASSPVRKSVSFHDEDQVVHIPTLKSYSQEEIDRTWLSRHEIRTIKDNCLYTLEVIEYGLSYLLMGKCSEDICLRGLEPHTSKGVKTRQSNKRKCRAVVLGGSNDNDTDDDCSCATMSAAQRKRTGAVIDEVISRQYSDASFRSALQAHVMGLKDALEAAKQ